MRFICALLKFLGIILGLIAFIMGLGFLNDPEAPWWGVYVTGFSIFVLMVIAGLMLWVILDMCWQSCKPRR